MRLLICAALIACAHAHGVHAKGTTLPFAYAAPSAPAALCAAQGRARRGAGRKPPPADGRRKSMPPTKRPVAPADGPVLDAPNRMEIDPGDIPPSERPRDPNVDDRTRIPGEVSPDDMAPRPKARQPKKRRP